MCKTGKRERKPSAKLSEAREHASLAKTIAKSPKKPLPKKANGKAPVAAVAPVAAHEENPNQLKFMLMGMTLSETKNFLYGRHIVSPDDVKFRVEAVEQGTDTTLKVKPGLSYWDFKLTCIHPDAAEWNPKERERIYSGPKMRNYVLLFSEPM
jgi:hypothetical protein